MSYTTATTTSGISWVIDAGTAAGTSISFTAPTWNEESKSKKRISPTLYFKFVKSKLTKAQRDKVVKRMSKLKKLIPYAKSTDQQAFYEELSKELVGLLKESEISALGLDSHVDIKDIEKFMDIVDDRVVKFCNLERFPRVIPRKIRAKLTAIKKTKVFDNFNVLYVDLTKEELKTNSQKIAEKDPILFGYSKTLPGKHFFIADWVDKYCDLTFDKFVDELKDDDDEFSIEDIEPINEKSFAKIVDEVNERVARLQETNSSNYRDKIREEEKKKLQDKMTKRWWKFWESDNED